MNSENWKSTPLPSFDALPLEKSGPPGNAWGLFGPKDELGMLNLLTPAAVVAAAQEIREGVRICLDWPLDKPSFPTFDRQQFHHEIKALESPAMMCDDVVNFNTQSSTQWDGFRHYGEYCNVIPSWCELFSCGDDSLTLLAIE
jgi:hypothetical protein